MNLKKVFSSQRAGRNYEKKMKNRRKEPTVCLTTARVAQPQGLCGVQCNHSTTHTEQFVGRSGSMNIQDHTSNMFFIVFTRP